MWQLDHKAGWAPKKWCFQTVVLKKTLESLLDSKEIKPANAKGYQPWILIGRTDAEAEAPMLWPPDVKSWLVGKDLDAGKDWGQKEKGAKQDEMVGWHHRPNGHEFEKTLEDSEGQGSLACCSPWGCKELDLTDWTSSSSLAKKGKAKPGSPRGWQFTDAEHCKSFFILYKSKVFPCPTWNELGELEWADLSSYMHTWTIILIYLGSTTAMSWTSPFLLLLP